MKIDQVLLDELTEKARISPRLRMNYDLRNSESDSSQRMLNAMEPGTIIPIHRHRTTSEVVAVLRGRFRLNFYDDRGHLTESFIAAPGTDISCFSVEAGRWHNSESLESGTVILECKDGAFEPLGPDDIFCERAPEQR